jgi:hypothetical protein
MAFWIKLLLQKYTILLLLTILYHPCKVVALYLYPFRTMTLEGRYLSSIYPQPAPSHGTRGLHVVLDPVVLDPVRNSNAT